jgi:CSLREA domain-containing protein
MNRKPFTILGAVVCALVASGTLALLPVYANSTIVVNTFADAIDTNGDCSLREAIIAANDNSTVDGCMAGSGDDSYMLTASGDFTTTMPYLLPLGDYGGATPTHKLSFLSPAIDAGSNAQCPATDQRDVTRPQAAACDIGTYERATDELPHFFYLPLMRKDAPDAR